MRFFYSSITTIRAFRIITLFGFSLGPGGLGIEAFWPPG